MPFPNKMGLRSNRGQYVRAEGGGGQVVGSVGTTLGLWETFTTIDRGNGQLALQASNGMYVRAEGGGGQVLTATADAIGPWETFTAIDCGNGQLALQASNGMYVRAEGGGGSVVTVAATAIGPFETFVLVVPDLRIPPCFGSYDFSTYFTMPQPGVGALSFVATAQREVYVGISDHPGPSGTMYEIVFGAGGTSTVLRRGPKGPDLAAAAVGLLSPGGSNPLWVALDRETRTIQAGRGKPGQNPILNFQDPQFNIEAQFVSFTTGDTPISVSQVQNSPVAMALTFSDAPLTAVHLRNPPKLAITNRISVTAWINPTAVDGLRNILARGYVLAPEGEVFLRINGGSYEVGSWNGANHQATAVIPPGDVGTWVHLAGVYDGSSWCLYRNGVRVSQTFDPIGAVPVAAGWSIGSRGDELGRSFRGMIASVSIWNTAIDENLLTACMAGSLTGLEPGLVGYWPLSDGAGMFAMDRSQAPVPGQVVQALWTLSAGPLRPTAPPPVIAAHPAPAAPFEQDQWMRCSKCQALFYAKAPSACAAGGAHEPTGSYNYHLFAEARPDGQGQRNWRWCSKCSGLYFGGTQSSACPRGNTHDGMGSADYILVSQEPTTVFAQPGWLWCSRCQGLYYSGGPPAPCSSGGPHSSSGSASYVVRYEVAPAATGTAQPATGLPPPTGDPIIDGQLARIAQSGISFSIFGVPFTMPLRFSGVVNTLVGPDTASFTGAARLESPFSVDVGRVELKLNRNPGATEAYLRCELPLSLSDLIQGQVQSRVPAAAWTAIELLAMPMLRSFDAPIALLSAVNGSDPELGPVVRGINFYKLIPMSQIEPFSTLNSALPVLHLEQRTISAHIGIGRDDSATSWQGTLSLFLNQSLGTDLVVLKSIAMMVQPGLGSLAAGVKVLLAVRVSDDETLNLTGGVSVKKGEAGASMTLWGALDAADGEWRNPLGLRGLTIKGLGIEIGAATVFPFIALGFRGEVFLGDALLRAVLAFSFDPADLGSTVLHIASPEGINLMALLRALLPASFVPPSLFDVALTDLNFYLAPKGGNIAGKPYAKGAALGGKLNLWGYRAEINGLVDYNSGASLSGAMDRISIKAGSVGFIELTGADGQGNPTINIDLNASKQGARISGQLKLLDGFHTQRCDVDISSGGFSLELSTRASGIYAQALVKFDGSSFSLTMAPDFNFGFTLLGVDISVRIRTQIGITAGASGFSQSIGFAFSAFGADVDIGALTLNVPISTLDDLRHLFEQFADSVKEFFKNKLLSGLTQAYEWVRDNLYLPLVDVGQLFVEAGVQALEVAKSLVNIFAASPQDAALAVAGSVSEASDWLLNVFHLPSEEVSHFLGSVGSVFSGGLAAVGSMFGLGSGDSSPRLPEGAFRVGKSDYYGGQMWQLPAPGRGAVSFAMHGPPAAKIAFSPTASIHDPMFEIAIGADENRSITLRHRAGGPILASQPGGINLLDGDRFWVAIDGTIQLVQVGRGAIGTNLLFSFADPMFVASAQHVILGMEKSLKLPYEISLVMHSVSTSAVAPRLYFADNPASAVQLGNLPKLDIHGPITISAFIRPLSTSGLRNIVARGYQLSPAGEVFLRIHEGHYQFGSWNGADHKVSVPIPARDLGEWVHLTGTYDGTAWTLYHNGHFMARAVDPVGAVPVVGGWAIGSCGNRSLRCFHGYISEVTIWDRAVAQATIDLMMQGQLVAPAPGLKGYWRLREGYGSTVPDRFLNSSDIDFSHTMSVQPTGGGLASALGLPPPPPPANGAVVGASWNLVTPEPKPVIRPQSDRPTITPVIRKPGTVPLL